MVTPVKIVMRPGPIREYLPILSLVTGFCLLLVALLYAFDLKESVQQPPPHPDQPLLGAEPAWQHLQLALQLFNSSTSSRAQSASPGCKLPKLDPWDPAIMYWVAGWPKPYAKGPGIEDLLYTSMDRLHFNTSWLGNLSLRRKEVQCQYSYYGPWPAKPWTRAYPAVKFEGDVVTLSPKYNAIDTKCTMYNGTAQVELSHIVLFYVTPPKVTKSIHGLQTTVEPYSKTGKGTQKPPGKERKKTTKLLVQADKTKKKAPSKEQKKNKELLVQARKSTKKPSSKEENKTKKWFVLARKTTKKPNKKILNFLKKTNMTLRKLYNKPIKKNGNEYRRTGKDWEAGQRYKRASKKSVKQNSKTSTPTGKQYSIANFVIDSLSQMNMYRSLPRSVKQAEAMGGIVFKGHHKVGVNSKPNMMAMISGSSAAGRTKQPLITGLYHSLGWKTVYFEDMLHWVGTALRSEGMKPNPWDRVYHDVWFQTRRSANHQNPLNTIRDLLLAYKDVPSFIHTHLSEYIHDSLNMGKNYDEDLLAMLTNLTDTGALKDTFFLLMGDHGYRQGKFAATTQGKIENNMPGLIVIPPVNFARDHPHLHANLKANTDKLTSMFDIHHMLRQVLALAGHEADVSAVYSKLEGPGASLLSHLPPRSCSQAGVPLDFCSCPEGHVGLQPSQLEGVARAALTDMNIFLQPLWGCQQLVLENVTDSVMKTEGDVVLLEALVTVTARPAKFQLMISHSETKTKVLLTRIDHYSNTALCVPAKDSKARPHCVCPSSSLQ